MNIFEIRDLHVEIEGKEVLKGITLQLELGKINALMGPNGSGKSTLANVLMGNPKYKVTSGIILFNGEDITALRPDERAKKGLFLSFQNPIEVSGVTIYDLLKSSLKNLKHKKMPLSEFKKEVREKSESLGISDDFLRRYVNEGFSGGEKKKAEILQLLMIAPEFAILDETDSGLDIDSLKIVSKGVNKIAEKGKSILIITHYKRILNHIKPDRIFIMANGNIVYSGGSELVNQLEEKGYGWIVGNK